VLCWGGSGSEGRGWGGRGACTTNSPHERLMRREQLSPIVSPNIFTVPRFCRFNAQLAVTLGGGEMEKGWGGVGGL